MIKRKWKLCAAAALLLWSVGFHFYRHRNDGQQDVRLLAAVRAGDRIEVMSALEDGAAADGKDSRQCSALMLAAARGDIDIVRSLLDSGAEVNGCDKYGMTALMRATASGNAPLVALLIFWHADLNARNEDGMTALKLARELAAGTMPAGDKWRPLLPTQRRQSALILQMLEQAGARD